MNKKILNKPWLIMLMLLALISVTALGITASITHEHKGDWLTQSFETAYDKTTLTLTVGYDAKEPQLKFENGPDGKQPTVVKIPINKPSTVQYKVDCPKKGQYTFKYRNTNHQVRFNTKFEPSSSEGLWRATLAKSDSDKNTLTVTIITSDFDGNSKNGGKYRIVIKHDGDIAMQTKDTEYKQGMCLFQNVNVGSLSNQWTYDVYAVFETNKGVHETKLGTFNMPLSNIQSDMTTKGE